MVFIVYGYSLTSAKFDRVFELPLVKGHWYYDKTKLSINYPLARVVSLNKHDWGVTDRIDLVQTNLIVGNW